MKHIIHKGDYVVIQTKKEEGGYNAPQLVKVKSTSNKIVGRVEKDPHIVETNVEFDALDILVNLGNAPTDGKVYGFDLSMRYRGSKAHDEFGDVHFFTKPEAKHADAMWKGLDRAFSALKSHGLGKLPSKAVFELEVYPKRGKYAGMYIHSKDYDKRVPRVQVSLGDKTIENASLGNYTYVIIHEFAHVFDYQFLSGYHEMTAKWIDLYLKSIGPLKVSPEDCDRLLTAALDKEGSLKDYASDLDDEDKIKLRMILKWIKEQKSVIPYDLNELFTHRSKRSERVIREIWPGVSLRTKRPKPLVTEYACVNRRELFAESFAFFMLNKELPAAVSALVEESIQLGIKQLKS